MSTYHVDFRAIGTTASVVTTNAADLVPARAELEAELERVDWACSRFRRDSEVALLARARGEWVTVSDTLVEAVSVALRVARMTGGLVDPTVGPCLVRLGYDRDFTAVQHGPVPIHAPCPAPGWRSVELDVERARIRVPTGLVLDLGATAKALVVDRAARRAAAVCTGGVLVNVGGDLCVTGPAVTGGWPILVADSHRAPMGGAGQRIAVHSGAVATSSTAVRRWRRGGEPVHHIVDPATGWPVTEIWRTVSVAAASCVDANAASTAAFLLGEDAVRWLADRRLPARLQRPTGAVVTVGGWPLDAGNEPGRADGAPTAPVPVASSAGRR